MQQLQLAMSTNKYNPDDLLSDDEKPSFIEILQEKLEGSIGQFKQKYTDTNSQSTLNKIKSLMAYREDLIFTFYAGEPYDYFVTQWNFIRSRLPEAPYNFQKIVADAAIRRVNAVVADLDSQKITIEQQKQISNYNYDTDEKKLRAFVLQGQSQQIKQKLAQINNTLQSIDGSQKVIELDSKDIYAHLYSKQKKLQVQEFLRKKRQQKEQRKKKQEALKIKQEQENQKKEKELQQQQQKQLRERKEESLKRNLEFQQKRNQQKTRREQQRKEYEKLMKSLGERPRLFEVLQKNYEKKKQYEQMERKHRMISQNKARYIHIDDLKIEEHEKQYEKIKKDKAQDRQKRYEEYIQEQQKIQVRHSSALQLSRELDKESIQKQKAKQKLEKIKYFQNIVKQKFKPKIDQSKRKQMLALIQQLQLNSRKKLKKTKLENGTVIYEQVKELDPRVIGIQYLEKTKQMAVKARSLKGSSSMELQTVSPQKKQFDYLQSMRKNPKARPQRKLSFVDKPNITFDEKIGRVLAESQRLNDFAKQNEMKLKFGKFKTSQQILNCKQQIDQSYLDIAKMKLKLIKDKT